MVNHSDIHFLAEKIMDLRSALLFSQNNSVLKLYTTIVNILHVDELGQLWFTIARPRQALQEFDREFPVRMEFFRKGKGYFMHITGKAFIINDPEEINSLIAAGIVDHIPGHMVLIKVKMSKADYFEPVDTSHTGWWRDLRMQVYGWLFNSRPGYKPYHLSMA